jgi:hypothetical protein
MNIFHKIIAASAAIFLLSSIDANAAKHKKQVVKKEVTRTSQNHSSVIQKSRIIN